MRYFIVGDVLNGKPAGRRRYPGIGEDADQNARIRWRTRSVLVF
jgi:hypothetical protein